MPQFERLALNSALPTFHSPCHTRCLHFHFGFLALVWQDKASRFASSVGGVACMKSWGWEQSSVQSFLNTAYVEVTLNYLWAVLFSTGPMVAIVENNTISSLFPTWHGKEVWEAFYHFQNKRVDSKLDDWINMLHVCGPTLSSNGSCKLLAIRFSERHFQLEGEVETQGREGMGKKFVGQIRRFHSSLSLPLSSACCRFDADSQLTH